MSKKNLVNCISLGGGGYFLLVDREGWGCATGWGRIFGVLGVRYYWLVVI